MTVTKSDDASWDLLKPEIFAAIMDFYSSGQPLFLDSQTASAMDTAIHEVCGSFIMFGPSFASLYCLFWSDFHQNSSLFLGIFCLFVIIKY